MRLFQLAAAVLFTISLAGAEPSLNCRYSFSPIAAQHTAEGGLYRLRVTASHPQCPWTVTPAAWVHVTAAPASQKNGHMAHGSMDLTYELLPNFFEQPRVAKLRLETAGRDGSLIPVATVVVRQQGRGQ
ncbi:MAG: hypothetical protein K2X03_05110 [Bryobacteraceae bacterium]|nr:hypothetical protein [Bryobacteraceae bacterium]